eukprot:s3181_g6.t1
MSTVGAWICYMALDGQQARDLVYPTHTDKPVLLLTMLAVSLAIQQLLGENSLERLPPCNPATLANETEQISAEMRRATEPVARWRRDLATEDSSRASQWDRLLQTAVWAIQEMLDWGEPMVPLSVIQTRLTEMNNMCTAVVLGQITLDDPSEIAEAIGHEP